MNLLCLTQEKINIIMTNLPRRVTFECSLGIVLLSRAKFINLAGEGLWPHFVRNKTKCIMRQLHEDVIVLLTATRVLQSVVFL